MPSAAKTKSGRIFRAPTDQARKLERKRENKKNKKDRQQIRQTIAKCLNVDECTQKMLAIERQILGLDAPQFHMDVLRKKQRTVMEMLDKRRTVLQNMKDSDELTALNGKLQNYHSDQRKLKALAEQERMARTADVNFIPLPDGDLAEGEGRQFQLMGPQPVAPQQKKRVDFRLPRGPRNKLRPPGPPCGLPPALSDSEGEDEYPDGPDDDDLAPVPIPDFDGPGGHGGHGGYNKYAPVMPIRKAPGPPPPMPPAPMYNPMGIPMPPRPQHNNEVGAVISSAPVIRRDVPPTTSAEPAPTVVSAAPQLRDLRKETIKLVPAVLKRARPAQPAKPRPQQRVQREETQTAKSTDDAYNEFMKELGDLI